MLVSCATPPAPQAIRRLPPAELAAIEAAGRVAPLTLDDIVRRSREGVSSAALVDEIRRTGTRHPLTPAETARLRDQGVAQPVLDELAEVQARWARDQATADKVRVDTVRVQTEDRARAAEEERRRRAYQAYPYPYYSPYYSPLSPYPYPGRFGYGGFGWGVQIRR